MNMSKIFYITASNVKKKKTNASKISFTRNFSIFLNIYLYKISRFLALLKEPLRMLRKNQKKTKTSKGFKKSIPFFNGKLLVT